MLDLGRINNMLVLRQTSVGMFIGNEAGDEVLLPFKYIPATLQVGDKLDVFVYLDSEERPIATTLTPTLMRDEFGFLEVKEQSTIGAFLDWGLEKDLFLPYREQNHAVQPGKKTLVYLYLDKKTGRLAASNRIRRFLQKEVTDLKEGMVVELFITHQTDLGFNVVVNRKYEGLLYGNEIFQPVKSGETHMGYVTKKREDGKLDLRLQPSGVEAMEDSSSRLINLLKKAGGSLNIGDKTAPEIIYNTCQMSKKNFKKAAGILYKKGIIRIEANAISLV